MFFRHGLDKLIYPLVLLILLFLISYRPKYHLRTEMPPAFFSAPSTNTQQRDLETRIAWAYWESAVMDVQWKYPHGRPLPPDPPAEFRINAKALGPTASDLATRQLYWRRLQQIWYAPEIWTKDYGWDWGWASDPIGSTGQWLKEQTDRLFSVH
jgi:hypothetical protein